MLLALALGALAGCDSSGASATAYGGPQNHVHDILALAGVPHVVLLATHIGLYRSANGGTSWTEVAGGNGQAMDGLMIFKLAQSPVDPQRVYVLAVPRTDNPQAAKAPVGIYTSTDAGQTWKLAAAASVFPSSSIYSIGTGSASAGQVYAILQSLGNHGVYVSNDAGKTWNALPELPTTDPGGIIADPAHPGHVFLWSIADGLFESADSGATWTPAPGIQGGVYFASIAGSLVYAVGDSGFYLSRDSGAHFTLVDASETFSSVQASPSNPTQAYALTGSAVYVSTDAGTSWHQAAATSQHPGVISVDPQAADTLYVALSYPVGVEMTSNSGHSWHTVLP
ncbi:MAG TPA: hypothetical protein VKT52_01035 [Ktedonobacterales bacterium]|nr:hypothetical protein [Ktedonobacterales bacterium]